MGGEGERGREKEREGERGVTEYRFGVMGSQCWIM